MEYKQVRSKKIYEMVAEQIQEMIKNRKLKPGDKLDSVEQLAKKFNVGRSAIREALSALRAIGLIDIRQGEGTFISTTDIAKLTIPVSTHQLMNKREMFDFFEVRKIIESGTAASAANKRTDVDLQNMQAALDEMKRAVGNEDLGEKADATFHLAIAQATHNETLIKLMNQVADTLYKTMRESRRIWLFAEETTFERLYQEHTSIYNAIADQNETLAQQLMLAHLVKVENVLIRFAEDS